MAPPSKSFTNRAYIIAALADGPVRIANPLISDDTRYMTESLREFGISVDLDPESNTVKVTGQAGKLSAPQKELFVGNAGTTMRFLTTFATLAPGVTQITGDERMQERPIGDLLSCLKQMGVRVKSVKNNSCPPLEIQGGHEKGGHVSLRGDKSSQYLTSILMSAPYFEKETVIEIEGDLTSKPYADITLDIMKSFGVSVINENYKKFIVPSGQTYRSADYTIEGDASNASYFFAAAAVTGGEVTVIGVNPNSVQGDIKLPQVLQKMGCAVTSGKDWVRISGKAKKGIDVDMNAMPDVAQTLAVIALFAEGPTRITGIGNLRIKETDRIHALAQELTRLGATCETGNDFLVIHPGDYQSAAIETYHDHRMAMSFAVAGLKIPGVQIKNPQCVDKSFPDFFERFQTLYG